jgi:glyoxylase-like metal-dependent hydrolase (beta-lactamase superfamily II)
MAAQVEHVTTSGIFSIDGEDFEVENNIWLYGDDTEVLIVDAAHEAGPIADVVGDRRVTAIVCTHGHNDHINAAVALAEAVGGAPILIHEADRMLWDNVYPDRAPDGYLADGQELSVADSTLRVVHTPGHSPGGVCLVGEDELVVFGGDTLFKGGPGATGRSFSSFETIIDSISTKLLTLPEDTVVHTGHGDSTTVGEEAPHLDEWITRGS